MPMFCEGISKIETEMSTHKIAEILSVQFDDFLEKNLPMVISLWIYRLPRTRSRKTVLTAITQPFLRCCTLKYKIFSYNFNLSQGTKILDSHLTLWQVCP